MPGPGGSGAEFLIVGRIRRAHGVRGEVSIAIDTDRPDAVFARGRMLRLGDAAGEPVGRELTLEKYRPVTRGAIVALDGITTRDEAEGLRGHTLLIPAEDAAASAPDEVHYRDLIGMSAEADGREIGIVQEILEMPTGEILVIHGPAKREHLIPFVKEMIEAIDVPARRIRLTLPEGLLDI